MTKILTALVGSRLHNLHTEKSDHDYRGIFMSDLKDILSPYKKDKNRSWVEGDIDNTSYELRDFCKFATQGNMTILEILWSDKITDMSDIGEILIANRDKFSDSKRIFEAARGYASNQLKKMDLFTPRKRNAKFAASYIRVMYQGEQMLLSGELPCHVTPYRDFIMEIKNNFTNELAVQASRLFTKLEIDLIKAYETYPTRMVANKEWVETFLLKSYLQQNDRFRNII